MFSRAYRLPQLLPSYKLGAIPPASIVVRPQNYSNTVKAPGLGLRFLEGLLPDASLVYPRDAPGTTIGPAGILSKAYFYLLGPISPPDPRLSARYWFSTVDSVQW